MIFSPSIKLKRGRKSELCAAPVGVLEKQMRRVSGLMMAGYILDFCQSDGGGPSASQASRRRRLSLEVPPSPRERKRRATKVEASVRSESCHSRMF